MLGGGGRYPKLPADFWDSELFYILPTLIIFDGLTGADPAWLNNVSNRDKFVTATTESGFIDTLLKLAWYRHCKSQESCPWSRVPVMQQTDNHASNEGIGLSIETENDGVSLVGTPGHSTHATQQCDQRGGPIQHAKRILRALLRHMYRVFGKLSRARICQAVELAIVLAFTPAVCSRATEYVGWGEDSDGKLIYEPLSRPHILAVLDDDESASAAASAASDTPAGPVEANSSAHGDADTRSRSAALAAFRSRPTEALAVAERATIVVLGQGTGANDGWDDDGDGAIPEAGTRKRRRNVQSGQLISSKPFRDARHGTEAEAAAKAAEATERACKKHRMTVELLAANAQAERKLADDKEAPPSATELRAYVRARTGKPPHGKKESLKVQAERLRDSAVVVVAGNPPDGYGEWLAAAVAKRAAAAAAASGGSSASGGDDDERASAPNASAAAVAAAAAARGAFSRRARSTDDDDDDDDDDDVDDDDDKDNENNDEDIPCDVCGDPSETARNPIVLCDGCDEGARHLRCCSPSLSSVPSGDWFCGHCAARNGSAAAPPPPAATAAAAAAASPTARASMASASTGRRAIAAGKKKAAGPAMPTEAQERARASDLLKMADSIGALGISSPSAAERLRAEAQCHLDAAAQFAK